MANYNTDRTKSIKGFEAGRAPLHIQWSEVYACVSSFRLKIEPSQCS